jgi:hypothetical protein
LHNEAFLEIRGKTHLKWLNTLQRGRRHTLLPPSLRSMPDHFCMIRANLQQALQLRGNVAGKVTILD